MFRIAAAFLLIVAGTPATGQTILDQLKARVTKLTAGTAPSTVSATLSDAQAAAIERLITKPMGDPQISADRAAAATLVRTLLVTAACARNATAFNALNRHSLTLKTYAAGGGGYVSEAPMRNMRYHNANACLDVQRLTEWTKPALNALRFKAFYVAGDSGEAASQTFVLQKDAEGRWLVRSVGNALS